MKPGAWLICLLVMLFSPSASAEFYKYIDENGNIRYTDDLSTIPENRRTNIHEYTESQDAVNAPLKDEENQLEGWPLSGEKQDENPDASNDLAEIKKGLDEKKEGLRKEYQSLMEEKEQIAKDKKKIRSGTAARKYNKTISELNEKIEDYEARRKMFNAEVKQYNAKVKKDFLERLEASPPSEQ
jgi:hypothetical protein